MFDKCHKFRFGETLEKRWLEKRVTLLEKVKELFMNDNAPLHALMPSNWIISDAVIPTSKSQIEIECLSTHIELVSLIVLNKFVRSRSL